MPEILLALLDEEAGNLLVESTDSEIASEIGADLAELLGDPEGLACARPLTMITPGEATHGESSPGMSSRVPAWRGTVATVRVSGWWHASQIEGPGRRSVVRMQGCPIRCFGCYVPETWDFDTGEDISVQALAEALLDPAHERDGVTVLGGEPFAQPHALAELVDALRAIDPNVHVLSYTGFTLEALRRRNDPHIDHVLNMIDMVIDGPYVMALSGGAGPWTGSGNQRIIDMPATRSTGEVVLWQEPSDA